MSSLDKALETQIKNMQARAGKSLDQLFAIIRKSGLTKFGEIRDMLKHDLGMGHGDANTLVQVYTAATAAPKASGGDVLDEIYAGPKAELRPIVDAELIAWVKQAYEAAGQQLIPDSAAALWRRVLSPSGQSPALRLHCR